MSRFEVKTPVPFYTGRVAGISFAEGRAVVTSDTDEGMKALYYFKTAGYGVAGLDDVEIDEVLARGNEDATAEHARLSRENTELENRLELDELRKKHEALQAKVFKRDGSDEDEAQPGDELRATTQPPLLEPPVETASQSVWRKWAVDSGRVTADEARTLDKNTIVETHGAAYDRERAARLKADAASGDVTA
jgi:hypothetical protein